MDTILEPKNQINIEDEMKRSYLDYAMSVIIGRALPDVRDGLKPVHRRVLWAMHELGNTYNRPHKKSARVVGDVIGKYHPHGDVPVYDTIVRLTQDFSMRYPLIDGQGNFGSVDGDAPAAMRYTEVRMARLANQVLADIEKETVVFQPNYDESLSEPTVLPARIPNLLINGSDGIAVGMATKIPPHNLTEIVNATLALLKDPETTVTDLTKIVTGPDFPTGGVINLAIVNGQPRVLNLKQMLEAFIEFRREVVRKRTEYELRKARARAHILEGLTKAIDALDYIVTLIRNSRSVDEARQWLIGQ